MYTLQRIEPKYFDFKIEGREGTYRMIAIDCIPQEDLDGYIDAAEKGEAAINRWARNLFERECPGAIDGLRAREFNALLAAWRDGADLGE